MSIVSLPISILALGMIIVILITYARALSNQRELFTVTCTLLSLFLSSAAAVSAWFSLANAEFLPALYQLSASLVIYLAGALVQRRSYVRKQVVERVVQRLAAHDSMRFCIVMLLFAVALALMPIIVALEGASKWIIGSCFGALLTMIATFAEGAIGRTPR